MQIILLFIKHKSLIYLASICLYNASLRIVDYTMRFKDFTMYVEM